MMLVPLILVMTQLDVPTPQFLAMTVTLAPLILVIPERDALML
jgi:hypothetical protein